MTLKLDWLCFVGHRISNSVTPIIDSFTGSIDHVTVYRWVKKWSLQLMMEPAGGCMNGRVGGWCECSRGW